MPTTTLGSYTPVADRFLASWQSLDAYELASYFGRTGHLCITGEPLANGREAVRRALVHMLARVVSLQCEVVHRWTKSGVTVLELDVRLRRDDDQVFTAPLTITLWTDRGFVQRCRMSLAPEPNWPLH